MLCTSASELELLIHTVPFYPLLASLQSVVVECSSCGLLLSLDYVDD